MATKIDVSGVTKRGGEFVAKELELAADQVSIKKAGIKELIAYSHDCKT